MELATGKVRYEFSGPGAYGWFAAFTPKGDAFLASALFGKGIRIWPSAHTNEKGRRPPTPSGTVPAPKRAVLDATVSSRGHVALTTDDGGVHLRALEGEAPTLAPVPGTRSTQVTFDASGRHLAAVREGKVHVFTLP